MTTFLHGVAIALVALAFISLYRVLRGPTVFDRLTGLGVIGTKTVVLLVVLGALSGRVDLYTDIAQAYALVSFVGVLALAKYFEQRGTEAEEGEEAS